MFVGMTKPSQPIEINIRKIATKENNSFFCFFIIVLHIDARYMHTPFFNLYLYFIMNLKTNNRILKIRYQI